MSNRPPKNDRERLENLLEALAEPEGGDDAFEEEMRAAKVDWQMHVYGGAVHSFTNPDADKLGRPEFARYDAKADARSWATMRAFFDEIF